MRTGFSTLAVLGAMASLAAVAVAAPSPVVADEPPTKVLAARQRVVTPPPCQPMNPPPTDEQVAQRHYDFGQAFLIRKNLTEAFTYIDSTYINHNPYAGDGPNAALDALGPIWSGLQIEFLRQTYQAPMGWLNYRVNGGQTVVDRYRWVGGCIHEHWDQGETYPANVPTTTTRVTTSTPVTTTTPITIPTTPITTSTPITTTSVVLTTSSPSPSSTAACAQKWGQCGGQGWTGATCCVSGSTCRAQNQWYSQCL